MPAELKGRLHADSEMNVIYTKLNKNISNAQVKEVFLFEPILILQIHGAQLLRSADGMTHVLRSRLVMGYATSFFHWSCWDTFWIPTDHMDLCQTHCKQVPDFSRLWGHVVSLDQWRLLPVPTYGSTWVVLWLLFFRSAPFTFPSKRSTHRVRFRESLVVRLYSEIDQIHVSIEAQCVTTYYPWVTATIRN